MVQVRGTETLVIFGLIYFYLPQEHGDLLFCCKATFTSGKWLNFYYYYVSELQVSYVYFYVYGSFMRLEFVTLSRILRCENFQRVYSTLKAK